MKCPHCQHELRLMAAEESKPAWVSIAVADDEDVFELLFNCEECTHDWRLEVAIPRNTELHPKFWG